MEDLQHTTPNPPANGRRCAGCNTPVRWAALVGTDGTVLVLEPDPAPCWEPNTYVLVGPHRCRPASPLLDAGEPCYRHHAGRCQPAGRSAR